MKIKNRIISLLLVMVAFSILFSGCGEKNEAGHKSESEENSAVTDQQTEADEEPKKGSDPLERIAEQLENDVSFEVSYEYMNLAINGYSMLTQQQYGKDGSFHFSVDGRQWDHRYAFEDKNTAEYYYRYEEDAFVCYWKIGDDEVSRETLDDDLLEEMAADKKNIIGFDALFPSYMEDFTETIIGEEYTFRMPVDAILEDDSYLSNFLNGTFTLSGSKYDPSLKLNVYCTCIVEKDTFRPIKISYDFSEVKPHVLSDGALSGEWAMNSDFLYMYYEFEYNLPESVQIPEDFLNAA